MLNWVPSARADVISSFTGIITDPFKLGQASENILQSVNQINAMLQQLEGRTNQDLKDRIAQAQTLVDGVIAAVDRNVKDIKQVVADAELQMNQLEGKIVLDAEQLLNKAQCTAKALLDQDIEQGVSRVLDELRIANPKLTLFGIPIGGVTINVFKMQKPLDAYRQTRDALIAEYKQLGPTDDAFKIPQAFGGIATVAYFTRCEDTGNNRLADDEEMLEDEIKYKAFQQPWISVLHAKI